MTDNVEKIKSLQERLQDFQKDDADINKESIDKWKEEVLEVLEENQMMRFRRLKLYENVMEYLDDDLPF